MKKLNQNERVYFKIRDEVEGFATVAGDYDLLVILEPEKQIGNYSHIYVVREQIIDGPTTTTTTTTTTTEKPVVAEEVDDGL